MIAKTACSPPEDARGSPTARAKSGGSPSWTRFELLRSAHRRRSEPCFNNFNRLPQLFDLKVKSFVGTSQNAMRIQIWTALIAILLLKWLHHLSKAKWSLSNLASMLRLNLFTYRDLRQWLENPFGTPPQTEQLALDLG